MKLITEERQKSYRAHLINEEKSTATIRKYMRDIDAFDVWLGGRSLDKAMVLEYKEHLVAGYAPASVNAALSSLNSFFRYCEWYELCVKTLKIQKQIFRESEKELTRGEYERLLAAAQKKNKNTLCLLMQTLCSTGIRVSELSAITVEAAMSGRAEIRCKGKCRTVFLPGKLCRILKKYIKGRKLKSGSVFVTKNGKPLDRSNIWSEMKKLCKTAGVSEKKTFPHNLRHLFARTYYTVQKDIVRLADILGHSNVNTTRIYTMESGETHRRQIEQLGLLRC